MKNLLIALIILASAVYADETGTVTVTGDRVSLRAVPDITAVLLDRAMNGDTLVLKDNNNPDWVGVIPPQTTDLWVNRDFIRDNAVLPIKLNVRSGPSLNHTVVGVLLKNQSVTVRGEVADWLKIAPTPEITVWISRKYVQVTLPEPVKPAEPSEAEVVVQEPKETAPTVPEPTVQEVLATVAPSPEIPAVLTVDSTKEQGIQDSFSGVLQATDALLYKLVDSQFPDIILCYVHGNQAQMAAYAGLPLQISGKVYWAEGLTTPVLRPEKIVVFTF